MEDGDGADDGGEDGFLLVGALEDGEHLDGDSAGDDEEVGLARGEAHDFGAEAGEVVA